VSQWAEPGGGPAGSLWPSYVPSPGLFLLPAWQKQTVGSVGQDPLIREPGVLPNPHMTAHMFCLLESDKFLRKWLVREGQGGASRPQPGQEVTVRLLGVLEDGTLVEKDPKLTFILEQGDVVQALELGVQSMQLGEVSFLLTSFLYAYGHLGRDPDIPPDASLLYEVTLLQIRASPDLGLLPPSGRISLSKQKRERGNYHFQRKEYQQAIHSYQLALGILDSPAPPSPEEEEELQEHRVKCLNNCAAAQLKLQLFEEVLASCNAVLRLDPDNGKALYRKGKVQPTAPTRGPRSLGDNGRGWWEMEKTGMCSLQRSPAGPSPTSLHLHSREEWAGDLRPKDCMRARPGLEKGCEPAAKRRQAKNTRS
uniref:peptidylprolyl isomerase n=1 Tax=Pelusios castaneus TaxID=367368 RepID=A0A8C8RS40_9SAUR